MGKIKKLWIGITYFIVIMLSSACLKTTIYTLEYEELKEQVVKIEIGYVHDDTGRFFNTLAVLQSNEIEPFLEEFCKLSFAKYSPPRNESGESVKLIYKSNAYEVISVYGGSVYDANGKYKKYGLGIANISKQAFLDLINQYIVEE